MRQEESSSGSRLRLPRLGHQPGGAYFWRSDEAGWDHPPLYLPNPLLILRVGRGRVRVETPQGKPVAESNDCIVTPFRWIEEILAALGQTGRGTERKLFTRPSFPLAVMAAAFEFGRHFSPHEHCFPRHVDMATDELLVAFHSVGFARMDNRWRLVGKPPGRQVRWRDWTVTPEQTDWPKPPIAYPENDVQSRILQTLVEDEGLVPDMPFDSYSRGVEAIHRHLQMGDIYQANLTARFVGEVAMSAERIFLSGLDSGGERYAALVRGVGQTHISFSPELFVRKWGRSIWTKPIKGTRPRRLDAPDCAVIDDLRSSEKDRAEHIMIVDLERNDLGRLCEYGSVRVQSLMEPTVHPTLVHMESTINGTLRSHIGLRDIFASLFPGGSVTGAPKKRALEILSVLETAPREIYCGALGWVDGRGDIELNLPIRTSTLFDDGRIHHHAGGAIVADSNVESEWREMQFKLHFMLHMIKRASSASVG
jgi:anthranilate/para-aminobenzoate synthase component I